ncbi:MAG TPA: hypothetical protein VNW29_03645, partial [Candidatus Sulfotelmatobacter sp.]|nr:hypothetical protein [Candidatus Sulfotelmatobacter sp.]
IIERSPDQEKPEIPQEVKDAGVTHSGPGVIDVEQNDFGVKKMPAVTFPQAIEEEKRTKLHDSKHWYMAMVMYIWRKLNPKMGEKNVSTEKKTQADQEPILPTKTVEEPED